jgi:hypothetical protein
LRFKVRRFLRRFGLGARKIAAVDHYRTQKGKRIVSSIARTKLTARLEKSELAGIVPASSIKFYRLITGRKGEGVAQ